MGHKSLFIFLLLLCSQAHTAWGMERNMNIIRNIADDQDDEEVNNDTILDELKAEANPQEINAKIEAKYPGWNEAIQHCPTASVVQLYPWWKTLYHIAENVSHRFNYKVNMNITPENWVTLMQLKLKQLKAPCVQFRDQNRSASALTYLVNLKLEKEWEVMTKHNKHIQWDMGEEEWTILSKQQEALLPITIAHLLNQCCNRDKEARPAPHQLMSIARQHWATPETKSTFIKNCLQEFQLQCQLKKLLEQKSAN